MAADNRSGLRIYHVIDKNNCWDGLTHGLALPAFCQQIDATYKSYTPQEWFSSQIERDSTSDAVFIIDECYGPTNNDFLRERIPNGKIVVFGGDTMYRQSIDVNPEWVDLWLDTMEPVVTFLSLSGVTSDLWRWTISQKYIERCKDWACFRCVYEKKHDAVCLMSVETEYRRKLVEFFKDNDRSLFVGRRTFSSLDEHLFPLYMESVVALGTTSSSFAHDDRRSMKGFRDWLAPFLGTVLIYDDHPQMRTIAQETTLPLYEYGDFGSILRVISEVASDLIKYCSIVTDQRIWAQQNTLECQYDRLFKRHQII